LKENVPYALTHTILYFIRRLIFAISLVFLGDYQALQNVLFIVSSLGLLTFQFGV
jgi:small basic protein